MFAAGDSPVIRTEVQRRLAAGSVTYRPFDDEPEVPHDTAVPTLALAGQFDPNITPEQSRRVADRIGPKARWVLFAGLGHNDRHFSACAQTLVAAFIAQPDRRADAVCAGAGEAFGPAHP